MREVHLPCNLVQPPCYVAGRDGQEYRVILVFASDIGGKKVQRRRLIRHHRKFFSLVRLPSRRLTFASRKKQRVMPPTRISLFVTSVIKLTILSMVFRCSSLLLKKPLSMTTAIENNCFYFSNFLH